MKRKFYMIALLSILIWPACDGLLDDGVLPFDELTKEEVIKGLKTALEVGTDTSVTILSAMDGYYKDELVKILLPEEAEVIYTAINSNLVQSLGLSKIMEDYVDTTILLINRSAEDASVKAKPIFADAIFDLSLDDAWTILQGKNPLSTVKAEAYDSAAATHYLRDATMDALKAAFEPDINASLDKDLVAGTSTNEVWGTLTGYYNQAAPYIDKEELDTELGPYVTQKALDGLFLKVANAERDIRRNPLEWAKKWAEDILDVVFGSEYTDPDAEIGE